jgi:hypothetical protein
MNDSVTLRVPSPAVKVLMSLNGVAALAAVWYAAAGHAEPLVRILCVAGAVALVATSAALRRRFGHDVVVDAQGIVEHVRGGPRRIAWSEPHTLEIKDAKKAYKMSGAKGAAVTTMMEAAQLVTVVVATPDGRRIRIDSTGAEPFVAKVRQFSPVARQAQL